MKTDEIAKLILKGHFEDLKNQASKLAVPYETSTTSLLDQSMNYLKKLDGRGLLDDEGKVLLEQLRAKRPVSVKASAKMPMKKARGRKKRQDNTRKMG